jgi:hypothetical protein
MLSQVSCNAISCNASALPLWSRAGDDDDAHSPPRHHHDRTTDTTARPLSPTFVFSGAQRRRRSGERGGCGGWCAGDARRIYTYEKTPAYAPSAAALAAAAALLPSARVVLTLRHPSERAYSAFEHHCRHHRYWEVDGFVMPSYFRHWNWWHQRSSRTKLRFEKNATPRGIIRGAGQGVSRLLK